jgi:hypothetical protein
MTPNTFCVLLGVHYIAWTFFYAFLQDIRPANHAYGMPDCAWGTRSHQGGLGEVRERGFWVRRGCFWVKAQAGYISWDMWV